MVILIGRLVDVGADGCWWLYVRVGGAPAVTALRNLENLVFMENGLDHVTTIRPIQTTSTETNIIYYDQKTFIVYMVRSSYIL